MMKTKETNLNIYLRRGPDSSEGAPGAYYLCFGAVGSYGCYLTEVLLGWLTREELDELASMFATAEPNSF